MVQASLLLAVTLLLLFVMCDALRTGGRSGDSATTNTGSIFLGIFMEPAIPGGWCATVTDTIGNADSATLPPNSNATSCLSSLYVRWAEQAGMRVVPIPFESSDDQLMWYLSRVNGVLLTGGIILDTLPLRQDYMEKVQTMLNYTVQQNALGDEFVLWGTCQGFEMLHVAAAGGDWNVLQTNYTGMEPRMLPLIFYPNATNSPNVLLSDAPENILGILSGENSTLNFHSKGVNTLVYEPGSSLYNADIADFFTPLSQSIDTSDQHFISAAEAKNANVYAIQFHPEKPPYDFSSGMINHDLDTLAVSSYFSFFLRSQLQQNLHAFDSDMQGNQYTIENYPVVNVGYGVQYYFI